MNAEELVNAINEILSFSDAPVVVRIGTTDFPVTRMTIEKTAVHETVVLGVA